MSIISPTPYGGGEYGMIESEHRFGGQMNAVDAAIDNGVLFKVHSMPIEIKGQIPEVKSGKYKGEPERKVLYRQDNDWEDPMILNVVPPQHPESNHQQWIETVEAAFPNSCTAMRPLDNGKRFMATFELGDVYNVASPDYPDWLQSNLLIGGSLDGTWPTFMSSYVGRLFCSNQCTAENTKIKLRRTTNHDQILLDRSLVLAKAGQHAEMFNRMAGAMRRILFTYAQYQSFLRTFLPEPTAPEGEEVSTRTMNAWEEKMKAVKYYWQVEDDGPAAGTAWAAWNAIQSAETHDFTRSSSTDLQIRKQVDQIRDNDTPLTHRMRELVGV
jgi:hypothetical protein